MKDSATQATATAVPTMEPPDRAVRDRGGEGRGDEGRGDETLSLRLRHDTAELHRQVEARLGLPESITTLAQYAGCLLRFYQLYRPIERRLTQFQDWPTIGIEQARSAHSGRLAVDLAALGVYVPAAEADHLPELREFGHALGAAYVIEGSALGSQYILPHLRAVLGGEIAGADGFFSGRGAGTGAYWREFRASLDLYGSEGPERIPAVVAGAQATFRAIGEWMPGEWRNP